jgi:hypothetical protein
MRAPIGIMWRVTGVASAVRWAKVHDQRFRPFYLGSQRRDECVFSLHYKVFGFAILLDPNGELHRVLLRYSFALAALDGAATRIVRQRPIDP